MSLLVTTLYLLLCTIIVGAQQESRCPDILRLVSEGQGQWRGELNLQSEFALSGLWIRIILDTKVQLVGTTFDAEIKTEDNESYLFRNPSYNLPPNQPITIPFFIKYSELEATPQIKTVLLNGRQVCPTPFPPPKISPCPGVFLYEDREDNDRWYGQISLKTDVDLKGVWVKVILDTTADLLGTKFGEVRSDDNQQYLIYNLEYNLDAGKTLTIPFFVKYSLLSGVPQIQTIRLNARTICGQLTETPFEPIPTASTKSVLPINVEQPIPTLNNPPPKRQNIPNPPKSEKVVIGPFRCGVRELGERIFFGIPTTIEQYPWHGAIFHSNTYVCGMSLISPYHALTAAHCFYNSNIQPVNLATVSLHFGLSNLRKIRSNDVQTVRVADIYKHPSYQFHIPMFDIAVIKFDRKVRFNEKIQPICLWAQDADLRAVENRNGVVVGFGVTEVGTNSDQLLWERILVVDSETCREVNPTFYGSFLSRFSFCAGNLTKTTVCIGDSGGGMYFQKPGTEIWQIRGITSTAKPIGTTCDNTHYAIFTDVAKYSNWIKDQMTR